MNATFEPFFVPNPSGRGTLGLVWQCIFTYSLCLWAAVHADVATGLTPQARNSSKLSWCLWIFLLPEFAFSFIIGDYFNARKFLRSQNRCMFDAVNKDTAERVHLAQPGHSSWCPVRGKRVGGRTQWNMEHAYLACMGGLMFKLEAGDTWTYLTEDGIRKLAACNMLPSAEYLSAKIASRGKSDRLAKVLVCIQVTWMVIQVIARRAVGLPVTLLELNTLAQAWFALACYAFWWYKPQGLTEPVEIDFTVCEACRKVLSDNSVDEDCLGINPPNENRLSSTRGEDMASTLWILAVSSVYLAIHAAAWNEPFPTFAECIVWRTAVCLFAAGAGCVTLAILSTGKSRANQVSVILGLTLLSLLTTLFVVESFVSLRRLPEGSYRTPSWSDMLPHLGG